MMGDKINGKAVRLALEVLKEALEVRGLNCRIEGEHPFVILNCIGGLLGEHPGFIPPGIPEPYHQSKLR